MSFRFDTNIAASPPPQHPSVYTRSQAHNRPYALALEFLKYNYVECIAAIHSMPPQKAIEIGNSAIHLIQSLHNESRGTTTQTSFSNSMIQSAGPILFYLATFGRMSAPPPITPLSIGSIESLRLHYDISPPKVTVHDRDPVYDQAIDLLNSIRDDHPIETVLIVSAAIGDMLRKRNDFLFEFRRYTESLDGLRGQKAAYRFQQWVLACRIELKSPFTETIHHEIEQFGEYIPDYHQPEPTGISRMNSDSSSASLEDSSLLDSTTPQHPLSSPIRTRLDELIWSPVPWIKSDKGTIGVHFIAAGSGIIALKASDTHVNEVIGNRIAQLLGLTIPKFRGIELGDTELDVTAQTRLTSKIETPGPVILFEYIQGSSISTISDGTRAMFFCDPISGPERWAAVGRILATDLFMANRDRLPAPYLFREYLGDTGIGNFGNIMVGQGKLYAIDNIFGLSDLPCTKETYIGLAGKVIFDIRSMTQDGYLFLHDIAAALNPQYLAGRPSEIRFIRQGFVQQAEHIARLPTQAFATTLPESAPNLSDMLTYLEKMTIQFRNTY